MYLRKLNMTAILLPKEMKSKNKISMNNAEQLDSHTENDSTLNLDLNMFLTKIIRHPYKFIRIVKEAYTEF